MNRGRAKLNRPRTGQRLPAAGLVERKSQRLRFSSDGGWVALFPGLCIDWGVLLMAKLQRLVALNRVSLTTS